MSDPDGFPGLPDWAIRLPDGTVEMAEWKQKEIFKDPLVKHLRDHFAALRDNDEAPSDQPKAKGDQPGTPDKPPSP
jgi:hypothetical protein